jgi:hypothetical protein
MEHHHDGKRCPAIVASGHVDDVATVQAIPSHGEGFITGALPTRTHVPHVDYSSKKAPEGQQSNDRHQEYSSQFAVPTILLVTQGLF